VAGGGATVAAGAAGFALGAAGAHAPSTATRTTPQTAGHQPLGQTTGPWMERPSTLRINSLPLVP
jgi:hypothetical protein